MVRFIDTGDEPGDELAPVIPLFGAGEQRTQDASRRLRARSSEAWHPTWTDEPEASADDSDSSVAADRDRRDATAPAAVRQRDGRGRSRSATAGPSGRDAARPSGRDAAEKALLRKLRTRSLSLRESRAVLAEHDLSGEEIDDLLDAFVKLGYLDDARLAEQLIHSGSDRRGQGRAAIAQTLAKRGIPRDVADAALQALPDDDAERALEFARSKAKTMRTLDYDTALRRLSGQLARRGYNGGAAMNAARTALDELDRPSRNVRFL
jgi:regulatory protein